MPLNGLGSWVNTSDIPGTHSVLMPTEARDNRTPSLSSSAVCLQRVLHPLITSEIAA